MRGLSDENTWRCEGCDVSHIPVELQRGEEAKCSRCGTRLKVQPRTGPALGLAWSLTALGMFMAAAMLPIMEVRKLGIGNNATILVATKGFSDKGMAVMGSISGLLVFWLPLIAILALITLNLAVLRRSQFLGWHHLLKLLLITKRWAMPEVFLLAVMIAFIKIGDLAEIQARSGLWFLLTGTAFLLAAMQRIDRDSLSTRLGLQTAALSGKSHHLCIALMLAALALLVPANLLPILELKMPGNHTEQTIIGGINLLMEHHMWGIAFIVFVASILVPFAKIGGLAWLLWVARDASGTRRNMKLYSILEFIGRWSMLDVFLVALLAGLIHFGQLAEVQPGTATPVFAAAVILTALAVEQFDTKRLWNPHQK